MKYKYDKSVKAFVREDNRGRKIPLKWGDAVNVCNLVMQGYTVEHIRRELKLRRIKTVTLKTFVKHFKEGNIIGLPVEDFENQGFWSKLRRRFK